MLTVSERIILGGVAGLAIWRNVGGTRTRAIMANTLDVLSVVAEGMVASRKSRLGAGQGGTLPPLPSLLSAPLVPRLDPATSTHSITVSDLSEFGNSPLRRDHSNGSADWMRVIRPPSVVLIVGKRGSGKSALAYWLMEQFKYSRAPYIVGAPSEARKLLPDWIGLVPSLEDLPTQSIAVMDEAYLYYHARQSTTERSTAMSQFLNLSRQRDQTLIFVSQEARQIDKNIVSAANVVIFKELGVLQLGFERSELRKLASKAQQALASIPGKKSRSSYVDSSDTDFHGLLENDLPSFWKPSLSRLFALGGSSRVIREVEKLAPEERSARAVELRSAGRSFTEIARELGVSKSTAVNYIKGYPYRSK